MEVERRAHRERRRGADPERPEIHGLLDGARQGHEAGGRGCGERDPAVEDPLAPEGDVDLGEAAEGHAHGGRKDEVEVSLVATRRALVRPGEAGAARSEGEEAQQNEGSPEIPTMTHDG